MTLCAGFLCRIREVYRDLWVYSQGERGLFPLRRGLSLSSTVRKVHNPRVNSPVNVRAACSREAVYRAGALPGWWEGGIYTRWWSPLHTQEGSIPSMIPFFLPKNGPLSAPHFSSFLPKNGLFYAPHTFLYTLGIPTMLPIHTLGIPTLLPIHTLRYTGLPSTP